jgi:hypothetical protein
MDLAQNIRSDRVRQKRKQPHARKVFNTVSCIVREYKLGEDFLELVDNTDGCFSWRRTELRQVKGKKVLELPPFSLVSQDEYRIAMAITDKLDNPYLQFAHSPEEVLLSAPLYEANPSLTSQDLLRHDFGTLLLCRCPKEELADLEKRLGNRLKIRRSNRNDR